MKLIVLGSGTCVPSLERNPAGYYLQQDNYNILVDCGSGTLRQLIRAGRDYKDIDAIFITHGHPDHFSDLMPIIHALISTPYFTRDKELSIAGPSLFLKYYNKAVIPILGQHADFPVKLIESSSNFTVGPLHVFSDKTVHAADSIAYRFEAGGRSIVFTGDADYDPGIINLSKGADLLVADCSFPDSQKVKGHMSSGECGLLAEKSGAGRLLLSHIYPSSIPDRDRINESRSSFKGTVLLAADFMEIDV